MAYQLNNSVPVAVADCLATVNLDVNEERIYKAICCRSCGVAAKTCTIAANYSPGTCMMLQCGNKAVNKSCTNWFLCVNCKKYVDKRRVETHFKTVAHIKAATGKIPTKEDQNSSANEAVGEDVSITDAFPDDDDLDSNNDDVDEFSDADGESTEMIGRQMMLFSLKDSPSSVTDKLPWIQKAFESLGFANMMEVINAFGDQSAMKLYFVAEFAKNQGGIQYLISRAFRHTEYIGNERPTTVTESCWHFRAFVQYTSMSDKQRKREASIIQALVSSFSGGQSLFGATRVLAYEELNRFYGRSNQHSLWNTLPVPTVENIGGIAYTNPINVIRYLFAFGADVDDYVLNLGSDVDSVDSHIAPVVCRITQCEAFRLWRNEILDSNDLPDFLKSSALLLWAVDWRDGFGSNRTKQNRKSTNAWTFSLSTPSDKVNSLSNTLPIAIGLKKNAFWSDVEHRFRKDMALLAGGLKPILVYHGGIRKCIPIFVRRLACLTDKVERADYTSSLSCTSPLHRYYGRIIKFDAPTFNVDDIEQYMEKQKSGQHDLTLKHFGWSCNLVDRLTNGGSFPSCRSCRKKTVDLLLDPSQYDGTQHEEECSLCSNWALNSATKKKLSFKRPKDYPLSTLPNCPVAPPLGREVGLDTLEYIDLDFTTMIQAARFAFFNSCGKRGTGWTKAVCKAYLRCCGINGRNQDLVFYWAKEAYKAGEVNNINYHREEGVGGFEFPAAWIGDMAPTLFIEMLMHLFFLGVAESNFKLCNLYMASVGRPVETFKRAVQPLLKALTQFNLSWLLALPFSGSDAKRTTGTWVSENWLAYVRISKIAYAHCLRKEIVDERAGANDVVRMVTSFTALVARVLSHAGATESTSQLVGWMLKEFLSSVRELDIRVRYKVMNALASRSSTDGEEPAAAPGDEKSRDQWWLKSNYVSCLNLPATICLLGPLVNFWDGGGKGERYIQEIKPHIPRGVRDGGLFFVRLLEKVYKVNAIQQIEEKHNPLTQTGNSEDALEMTSFYDVSDSDDEDGSFEPAAPPIAPTFDTDEISNDSNSQHDTGTSRDDDEDDDENTSADDEDEEQWSTPMEDKEMAKARTFYIYKRKADLDASIENNEPVAGVIIKLPDGSAQMYVLYKKPHKELGWLKITFSDDEGVYVFGMWYAPMKVQEAEANDLLPPSSLEHATKLARSATVAIPLKYTFGVSHEHALKYCVITNWWRERNHLDRYALPSLVSDLYEGSVN